MYVEGRGWGLRKVQRFFLEKGGGKWVWDMAVRDAEIEGGYFEWGYYCYMISRIR